MYKKSKRFLAGFLAFLLVVTMVPADMLSVVYAAAPDSAKELESSMITLTGVTDGKITYTGSDIKPAVTIQDVNSDAYDVTYESDNYTNAGTGKKVKVTPKVADKESGDDNTTLYGVAQEVTFEIEPAAITEVTLSADSVKAGEAAPSITAVKAGTITLTSNDYEAAYSVDGNTVEAGDLTSVEAGKTVTVTVTAKANGNFKDGASKAKATYTVTEAEPQKKDISSATVNLSKTEIESGADLPTVSKVELNGAEVPSSAYEVKYFVNGNEQTAEQLKALTAETTVTVKVTAKTSDADYEGTATTTFKIKAQQITPPVTENVNTYLLKFGATGTKAQTFSVASEENASDKKNFIYAGNNTVAPMISISGYTSAGKLNSSGSVTFDAKGKSVIEMIVGFPANSDNNATAGRLKVAGVVVANSADFSTGHPDNDKITAVVLEKVAEDGYKQAYKITVTLGTSDQNVVIQRDNGELHLYYVKVTEPATTTTQTVDLSTKALTLNPTTAKYTGEAITAPTATVADVAAANYKLQYARATGDTAPADTAYADTLEDWTSVGKIYIKAVHNATGYTGSTTPVAFEITKGDAPAIAKAEVPVDIAGATTEQTTADSMLQEIDLSTAFTIDSKYGTPDFKNPRVDDEVANNVLAATPGLNLTGTKLTFNSKAVLPSEAQKKATIKVDAEFANYATATLTIEVTLASKEAVTIAGTSATKVYDGTDAAPVITGLTFTKSDNSAVTIAETDLAYSYTAEDGTTEIGAPVNAGTYKVKVSVASNNAQYAGTSAAISYTITKAPITITAADRDWTIGYSEPKATGADSWCTVTGLVNGETLADLEAEVTYTYKIGNDAVTNWKNVTEDDTIVIVPALTLANYDVTAVNGTLTVKPAPQLGEGEHALDLMAWHSVEIDKPDDTTKKINVYRYGDNDALTDGYFTLSETTEVKTAGAGNGYPLIEYGDYQNVSKMNSGGKISFTAPAGSTLEITAHLQNNKALNVRVDEASVVTAAANGTVTAEDGVTLTSLGNGTVNPLHKDDAPTGNSAIHKVTVTLGAGNNGVHTIDNNGKNEFQLYYVKVTEPGSQNDTVTINPTISGTLPAGAKIVFTPETGDPVQWTGTGAVTLKKGTYTLSVTGNTDGKTYTAKINGSLSYEATANAAVEITVTSEQQQDPTKPATPVADPVSGKQFGPEGGEVTLTCENGAKIRYTTGDTDAAAAVPTATTGTECVSGTKITITKATTIKAIAVKDDKVSEVLVAAYTVRSADDTAQPEAKPAGGEVRPNTKVELSCETKDAKIYYTTGATEAETAVPTATSTEYKTPIEITDDVKVIKAIAIKGEGADAKPSTVATFIYTIKAYDSSAPTVKKISIKDCKITVPSYVENKKITKPATYVTYVDTEKNKTVTFTEGLDYEVSTPVKDGDYYKVTFNGLERTEFGRSVDKYQITKLADDDTTKPEKKYQVISAAAKKDPKVVDVSKAKITLNKDDVKKAIYSGYPITPAIDRSKDTVLKDVADADLHIVYKNNINAGKATVTISVVPKETTADNKPKAEEKETDETSTIPAPSGDKTYAGSKTLTFSIKKAALGKTDTDFSKGAAAVVSLPAGDELKYENKAIYAKSIQVVTKDGRVLTQNTDYTVTYKNINKAGKASVTIKGVGNNLSGSTSRTYTITGLDLTKYDAKAASQGTEGKVPYSPQGARLGKLVLEEKTPAQGAQPKTITLTEDVDFTAKYTYADPKTKKADSKITSVVIKGKNGCTGQITLDGELTIEKANFEDCVNVSSAVIDSSITDAAKVQKAFEKAVVVTDKSGKKLKLKKDYVIEKETAAPAPTPEPAADDASGTTTTTTQTPDKYVVKPAAAVADNYKKVSTDDAAAKDPVVEISYVKAANLAKDKTFAFDKTVTLTYDGRNPVEITQDEIDKYINKYTGAEGQTRKYILYDDTNETTANIYIVPGTYKNNAKKGSGSVTIRGIASSDGKGFYGTKVLKFKLVEG